MFVNFMIYKHIHFDIITLYFFEGGKKYEFN